MAESIMLPLLETEVVRSRSQQEAADWLQQKLLSIGPVTYADLVLGGLGGRSEGVALIHRGRSYSHEELAGAVRAAASLLMRNYGIRPGERVALFMDNSDLYVIAYLAIHWAGAVAVPLNVKLTASEIAFMLADCETRVLIADDDRITLASAAIAGSGQALRLMEATELLAAEDDAERGIVSVDANASIFYTSGTTGKPKGVVHTHRTLVAGALQCTRAWRYGSENSTTLAVTPLFHIASHSWFLPVIAYGGTLVVDTYGTERTFELIQHHGAQGFGAVPAMLLIMARHEKRGAYDLSSVTNLRFGASPMPPEKLMEVQEMFPNAELLHGMGQTESGGTISVLPGELAFSKAGSTGYPMAGCDLAIVDDALCRLPAREIGEVVARGPGIMVGYHGRPEATTETIVSGWLRTGDLGYLDEDGCVYLVDRKRDVIIRGGENIYSIEIENVLCEHPRVAQCAVIGMPHPLLGETVCAVLVVPGEDRAELIEQLKALCQEKLASFKMPSDFVFASSIPTTANGKLQKGELRKLLASAKPGDDL